MLFEQTSLNGVSLAVPGSRLPSFGFTMLTLRSGDFQRTDEMNNPLGSFSVGQTAYALTVARGLTPKVALGMNLKLVQETVEQASGAGFGLDFGGLAALTPQLKVGLALNNLGGPSVKLRDVAETYGLQVRGGAALALFDGRGLVALQLDHEEGLGTRLHAGTEYWLFPSFGLRAGLDNGRGTGGLSYRFAPQYQLDYAAADEVLGVTHRLGLAWRFGGFYASSHADPEAFSPTGEHPVTQIALNARTKTEADTWTLDVVNKSETVVRRFGGKGQPPAHVEWDGKDETGLALADGLYRYRLTVTDRAGRVVASPERMVELSTGGPQVKIPVVQTP